jgi:hypothetical protein
MSIQVLLPRKELSPHRYPSWTMLLHTESEETAGKLWSSIIWVPGRKTEGK